MPYRSLPLRRPPVPAPVPAVRHLRHLGLRLVPRLAGAALLLASAGSAPAAAQMYVAMGSTGATTLVDLHRLDETVVAAVGFGVFEGKSFFPDLVGGGTSFEGSPVIAARLEGGGDPDAGWALVRYDPDTRRFTRMTDLEGGLQGIATDPDGTLHGITLDPVRFVRVDVATGAFQDLGTFSVTPTNPQPGSPAFADLEYVPSLGRFLFVHRDVVGHLDLWSIADDGSSWEAVDHALPSYSTVYQVLNTSAGVALVAADEVLLLDLDASPVVLQEQDGDETYRRIAAETPYGSYSFFPFGTMIPVQGLACTPRFDTLCLRQGHFEVRARWTDPFDQVTRRAGMDLQTIESGAFWFVDPANQEGLVKILDGCQLNGHRWVFASTSTNLAFELRVRDTRSGLERTYSNPAGQPAPAINDTAAFPCE